MAAGVNARHCSPPRLPKHTAFLLNGLLFLIIISSEPGQRASAIPDRSLRVPSSSGITAVEPLLCSRFRSRVWTSCVASCFPSAPPVIGRCSLLVCWLAVAATSSSCFFFCYSCLQCAERQTLVCARARVHLCARVFGLEQHLRYLTPQRCLWLQLCVVWRANTHQICACGGSEGSWGGGGGRRSSRATCVE